MTSRIDRREFLIATGMTAGLAATRSSSLYAAQARLQVVGLRVDYLDQPLGLENPRPRFSWRLESNERNVRQSAYRIRVASSEDALRTGRPDLWDSGKIESKQSFGIEYKGRTLQSRDRCWWTVQVWDKRYSAPQISEPRGWEMGLLEPSDWVATWLAVEDQVSREDREAGLHWIWGSTARDAEPRQFRFEFSLPTSARSGILYVGAGIREQVGGVWIDGVSASLAPPRKYAATRPPLQDIALARLAKGTHVLAVEIQPSTDPLANSLPENGAAMAAFARFDMNDRSVVRLTTKTAWKTLTRAAPDWAMPSYDDQHWESAQPSRGDPGQPWPATPAMHLRKAFMVDRPVRSARLYATALGIYEARMNGQRVGHALLTPEVSEYRKRVLYRVYDVTSMLQNGANALGLTVGDGWYAGPVTPGGRYPWGPPPRRVLAQLELSFADDSRQILATGPGWRTSQSSIVRSEIYDGEVQDGRWEQPGWDTATFDDTRWMTAAAAETPPCRAVAQVSPPIRVTQVLPAQRMTTPRAGIYVFDFGQNFAGWCRLRAKGPAGTRIELRFAELLTATGEADQSNLRGALATDVFILRGDPGGEVFEPKFTYHGFRYAQVTGLPSPPTIESIEGIVIHSDLDITGQLKIDNPLIQQIWRNTVWTQRSNFMGVYTDCSQRDERLGWLADAGIFWDAAAFNMDVDAFTRRHMDDVRDDLAQDGALPALAPGAVPGFSSSDIPLPGWSDASVSLTWTTWQRYGDIRIIEQNWDAMNRYVQLVLANNPDHVWRNKRTDLGDWLAVDAKEDGAPTTPYELLATAYWARSTDLLSQMSSAIGRIDDAKRLRELRSRIQEAFAEAYIKDDGTVANDSQTGYILTLKYDLAPTGMARIVAQRLVDNIRARSVMLTSGMFGAQYSLDVLADAGYSDLAYSLLLRTDYPSWGYMIAKGATTMWERWNGDHGDLAMNSYNQPTLGAICGFLFRRVAGIDALTPGFEKIIVRPVLDPRIKRGGGDYHSIMGLISTDWEQAAAGGAFTINIAIPPNTEAFVHLPASNTAKIKEDGQNIHSRKDMRIVSRQAQEAVIKVGSGNYRFEVVD